MTNNQPSQNSLARSQDAWERADYLWSALFLGSVLVALFFMWRDASIPTSDKQMGIILSLIMMLWHIAWTLYSRRIVHIRFHIWRGLVYNIVLIALWFALVQIDEAFYFILFGMISQFYITAPFIPLCTCTRCVAGCQVHVHKLQRSGYFQISMEFVDMNCQCRCFERCPGSSWCLKLAQTTR